MLGALGSGVVDDADGEPDGDPDGDPDAETTGPRSRPLDLVGLTGMMHLFREARCPRDGQEEVSEVRSAGGFDPSRGPSVACPTVVAAYHERTICLFEFSPCREATCGGALEGDAVGDDLGVDPAVGIPSR
jgi:hypothetical protein